MSTLVASQLAMYQNLQRKLLRARRRMLRQPTPLMVRNFLKASQLANFFLDSLLMCVPTAHDEAVYALLQPRTSSDSSIV